MAVRNAKVESVDNFSGINTTEDATNLEPQWWQECNNVIVGNSGSATALRSPNPWNNSISSGEVVVAFSWTYSGGSLVIFDLVAGGVENVYTTTGTTNTLRYDTAIVPTIRKYLNVNDKAYQVDGTQFFQNYFDGASLAVAIFVGINPPIFTPSVSIVSGGILVLNVGVTVSYAYRNSVTLHVGQCSVASVNSGPTGIDQTLQVGVHAGFSPNDGIVLFISEDGGANRYLLIDATGNPIVFANATANLTINAPYILDTNTVETSFNSRPPDNGTFMFAHQNRIFVMGFPAPLRWQLIYSGLESIGIGQPTEAYPPLNIVGLPAKDQIAVGGISTSQGALILSDKEAYLLQGTVTDNVVSTQNTVQAAAILQNLAWGLGTRSPFTIQTGPYGVIWLDQTKRLQLWSFRTQYTGQSAGAPIEIGLAIRNNLKMIQDTPYARASAQATWFQYGEQQYYVLTASTSGTTNNAMFIIGMYADSETQNVTFTTAISDIPAQTIITHIDQQGISRCLIAPNINPNGAIECRLKEILDLASQGAGWPAGQQIYFGVTTGNFKDNNNFNHLHSVRFDSDVQDIQVQTRNLNDMATESCPTENEDTSNFALIDRYGIHGKLRFNFPTDDTKRREVKNMRITYSAKGRTI